MDTERELDQTSTGELSAGAESSIRTRAKFSAKRLVDFRDFLPDFDVLGSVIKPTVNLAMEMQEKVPDDKREQHQALMEQMLMSISEPDKAEKYFMEARDCLAPYPDVLALFDEVFDASPPSSPTEIGKLAEVFSSFQIIGEDLDKDEAGAASGGDQDRSICIEP
ncbi:hypothetical protein CPLU01_09548 [Colletotrichum plurivorum]|uniref:Uncharacterized protein n=1 Tax=Colletotrichum plurivorum TaxID=2175906 RepID=A0A8H6K8I7_9PEZI|nr:hypothetical protein CPLU01_09548 [Colletotrichum plurivorum]